VFWGTISLNDELARELTCMRQAATFVTEASHNNTRRLMNITSSPNYDTPTDTVSN